MSPSRVIWLVLLAAPASTAFAGPPPEPQLFVVLIGGMDSDPTAEQIAGTAARGRGNSGMYQLQADLRHPRIASEYFNWNGTRAGQIRQKKPPHATAIVECLRQRVQQHSADRLAIVGNSWGGHTALEVCRRIHDDPLPFRIDCVVFLDPSSTGRSLKKPGDVPVNVGAAVNYFTRNAFVWGKLDDRHRSGRRLLNIDLGDGQSGFLLPKGPMYDATFSFPAHVAAEWDDRIHADIHRRLMALVPGM